jgi:glucose/arabinose dehydrogenase
VNVLVAILSIILTLLRVSTPPATGEPRVGVVASGLEVPWALAFAPDGSLYVTERPGRVRVVRDGRLDPEPVAMLPAATGGEAGLMGLALDPAFALNGLLYVCYTTRKADGTVNRVSVLALRDGRAGPEYVLLDDIPGAAVHAGCRLKFGPDAKLYVTTGDAREPDLSQRLDSTAGKILRISIDGTIPSDNPFPGSPVWTLGHRNPQGLAWDRNGRLFAAEHGPSGAPVGHDELNLILPGKNYGWPAVYGLAGDAGFEDPVLESGVQTWAPSGIAVLDDHLYMALLRGQRLLRVRLDPDGGVTDPTDLLAGAFGRLREVVVGPDRFLYVTTSNRDGRGSPAGDDDRILRVEP